MTNVLSIKGTVPSFSEQAILKPLIREKEV